jgi:hypothetical protein
MAKARPVPNRRLPPRFWLLWASEGVSSIGSQLTLIALPLTAVVFLPAAPRPTPLEQEVTHAEA